MMNHKPQMQIGHIHIKNNLMLAPMAGISDRPFRNFCKRLGAGYAVSEMISANPLLWNSTKTQQRIDHIGEQNPIAIQITGTSPEEMALAAQQACQAGAEIVDINMGCPVKKVCQKWAGSALMQDEKLALQIIVAVIQVCSPLQIPVTLKMRTGWDQAHKNAPIIAKAAEDAGIAMLTIHGRTREQKYQGVAEYETIATIKQNASIPVVANGNIDSPEKALAVLKMTQADALMIGRAAQNRPWIFNEINHFLKTGEKLPPPQTLDVLTWIKTYLHEHYLFYGEYRGVRQARKHISWLITGLPDATAHRQQIIQIEYADEQTRRLERYLQQIAQDYPLWPIHHP